MADEPLLKRRVGRYEIIRQIGRGGMAIVYLARQETLEREVALKELSSFHASAPHMAERFLRESRLAGSLNHPNVVTVHEYFDEGGVPYIAMEYVPRGSLRPYVGTLTLAQLAGVMEGVLAGLAHAETLGIVHRDLKPENLMVTSDGRIKITDFGIAKATQSTGTGLFLTAAGTTIGTPTYMAPEQAMGHEVGPWTDLYSVGVMAWEHVVGRVPFHETTQPLAILMRHLHQGIAPVTELVPDADPELSAWIQRLLAKDASERTRSPGAAWDQLEEVVLARLGPRWRREARLPSRTEAQGAPRPLTPAQFASTPSRTPTPEPSAGETPGTTPDPGYVTFGRRDETARPPDVAAAAAPPAAELHVEETPPSAEASAASGEAAVRPLADGPGTPASAGAQIVAPNASGSTYVTFDRGRSPVEGETPAVLAHGDGAVTSGPVVESGPAAESVPGPVVESGSAAESVPGPVVEPVPAAESVPGPVVEPVPAAESVPGPMVEPVPAAESVPGPVVESKPAVESTPAVESESIPEAPPRRGRVRIGVVAGAVSVAVATVLAIVLLGGGGTAHRSGSPLLWKFNTGGHVSSKPAVAAGLVIFGSQNQDVYAVDARTGQSRWDFQTGEIVFSSATVSGANVYIGSNDHSLYALDLSTGRKVWQFQTQGAVESSPTVADGFVYVGSDDSRVYGIDAHSGAERWHFDTGQSVISSPRVSNGVVFVGSEDGQVYALDARRGVKLWRFRTGGQVWSSPALANGILYIGSNDHNVYALDQRTGQVRWRFATGGVVSSSPYVAGGTVYVGSFDKNVYALDASTGIERWRFATGNFVFSSPTVAARTVYVGSHDSHLYALDAASGRMRWAFATKKLVGSSPTVAGGVVFVGSDDGNMYALKAAGP